MSERNVFCTFAVELYQKRIIDKFSFSSNGVWLALWLGCWVFAHWLCCGLFIKIWELLSHQYPSYSECTFFWANVNIFKIRNEKDAWPTHPMYLQMQNNNWNIKTFGAKGNHSDADWRFSHNSPKSKFDNKPNWKDLYCTSCKTSTKKGQEACKSILPPPRGPTQW